MSLKFETVKPLNVGGLKMISIKTNEGERLFVKTGKCFSFGVKKDERFKTASMSLVLDLESVKRLEDIIAQCEEHSVSPLSKKVLYQKEEKTTIYPKFKDNTKLYETEGEINPVKYEDKRCDVKAVLEIGGILLNGDQTSLQMKVYEALVKEHVYEHVRLKDMTWGTKETSQNYETPRKPKYAMISSPTRGDPFCGGLVCN